MRWSRLLAAISLLAVIGGCGGPIPTPSGDPGNPIKRLAVLPLVNNTNDVEAPQFVRKRLASALGSHLYNVQPLKETDRILSDQMGITLGGQLEMADPQELARTLDVEGLLYGDLMDFHQTITGVYNSRNVRGRFRIVNAKDGSVFWRNGIGVRSEDTHGGDVGGAAVFAGGISAADEDVPWVVIGRISTNENILTGLAVGLGTKLITRATGTHLASETDEMIRRVFDTLPTGPGQITVAEEIPEIPMPAMPVFGYVDFGDRDFTAVMVTTTVDKADNRQVTFEMPVAKAGRNFRTEIDYAAMTQGESLPPSYSRMVTIHLGDEKMAYMLFPDVGKYMVNEGVAHAAEVDPDVTRTEVGREVIDGHPTIKYKVQVIYQEDVPPQEGFVWRASDLGDLIIKSEMENETVAFSTMLKNIVQETPDQELFEVPQGFVESKSFMEIVAAGRE